MKIPFHYRVRTFWKQVLTVCNIIGGVVREVLFQIYTVCMMDAVTHHWRSVEL